MPCLTLSDQLVATLTVSSGRPHTEYFDNATPGLYVDVLASGRKSYRLRQRVEGKLKVLIASQDMETGKVAQFLKDRGVTRLEPWLDPDNTLTTQYGVSSLPATILYDAQGREVWRYTGPRDWHDATSKAMLAEAG